MVGLLPHHVLKSKSPSYPGVVLHSARLRKRRGGWNNLALKTLACLPLIDKEAEPHRRKKSTKFRHSSIPIEIVPGRSPAWVAACGCQLEPHRTPSWNGNGTTTRKCRDQCIIVVPQLEPCFPPPNRRVGQRNGKVGSISCLGKTEMSTLPIAASPVSEPYHS
jgi:hypothetical protein